MLQDTREAKNRRRIRAAVNIGLLAVGLFLFAVVFAASGESLASLLQKTKGIRYGYLALAFAVHAVQSLFISKRWGLLLNSCADKGSLPRGFVFYNTNVGLLMTSFFPILGNFGSKAVVGKVEQNLSLSKTVMATTVEYMAGLTVVVAMLLPSALYALHVFNLQAGIAGMIVMTAGLLVLFDRYYRFLLRCLEILLRFIKRGLRWIPLIGNRLHPEHFSPAVFAGVDQRTTSKLVRLSLLAFFIILVRCFIYIQAFDIGVGFFEFALLFTIGYALSSLGLTPGNLGVAELGWFGVLTLIGIGRDDAAFFAIGKRIIDMAAIILLTAGSYVYYMASKKRRIELPVRRREEKKPV
jgi:uncharacterized protein (TIRG00374 family)